MYACIPLREVPGAEENDFLQPSILRVMLLFTSIVFNSPNVDTTTLYICALKPSTNALQVEVKFKLICHQNLSKP